MQLVGFKLTYPKGMDGASIVNGFVSYVTELERPEIAADIGSLISNRLARLEKKMEAQRASYNASKEAAIAALLEKVLWEGPSCRTNSAHCGEG